MRTPPRCGIIPPHLLRHLARSSDPERAARARATLLADAHHRTSRTLISPAPAITTSGTPAPNPRRTIYDAENREELPGQIVREEGERPCEDAAANRAYAGLGLAYDLLQEVYGRDSVDDHGMPLLASVHYGENYQNAAWDGRQMIFGDGDGDVFHCFTSSPEVMGHELAHGVIERDAGLLYVGQPGALSEHLADVLGSLTTQYHSEQTADQADWLIGDELFTKEVEGAALRSMRAPGTAYDDDVLGKDPQPAHMDDYVVTFEDSGGVHINSGILNRAFWLVATGLGGYAWEAPGIVWYRTLTGGKLTPTTDFRAFAQATHATAEALYGIGSTEAQAVDSAWREVGIRV